MFMWLRFKGEWDGLAGSRMFMWVCFKGEWG